MQHIFPAKPHLPDILVYHKYCITVSDVKLFSGWQGASFNVVRAVGLEQRQGDFSLGWVLLAPAQMSCLCFIISEF